MQREFSINHTIGLIGSIIGAVAGGFPSPNYCAVIGLCGRCELTNVEVLN